VRFVGKLPKIAHWPEVHTYRCTQCHHVISEEIPWQAGARTSAAD
jgi:hypothetical protein